MGRLPRFGGVAALAAVVWCAPALAQPSEVYVCAGPNGVPEYRNNSAGKGCKRLDLPDVLTVPGVRVANPGASRANGQGSGAGPAAGATASTFPRVDSATQRSRDSDRRGVLEQELQAEEARLEALRSEYQSGLQAQGSQKYQERAAALRDDIVRSEANTASLRRELNKLK